ncbi:glycosyltransferase family 4 protein [Oscillatoria sp. CS-180]|uniref:glycosyltransferase family 4 protein n=1 Tax=Oscillatoria sp. CS-180 TaxID=3021720 RepID=UPI00232E675F|nr:glycosyltransferase family 4 protein [Oscillatoria sp. CS-180]MDB9527396.1 glycosyltransferase family 4 protein [Oscillatoria sp. CS-180]
MSNLKLVFAPQFKLNPYQAQLAENLKKLGLSTQGTNRLDLSVLNLFPDKEHGILHLHWLSTFFIRKELWTSLFVLIRLFIRVLVLKVSGVKIVWTVHNIKDHENPYPKLDNLCNFLAAKLADAIIVHCKIAKQEVIETFGLNRHVHKVFVVPHGNYVGCYENKVDRLEARRYLNIDDSKVVFLFLGKIRPYKGVLELIEAFKQIDGETGQLVIAGKPFNDEMKSLIQEKMAESDRIQLVPTFIPEEEIQVYMNACDVVVFPYRNILTSGAIVLAMSFAKACIAPRMGCIGELLDDKGSFVYNLESQDGLVNAIENAIAQKDDLPQMGMHNLKLAQELGWPEIAKQTLGVYEWCLERET